MLPRLRNPGASVSVGPGASVQTAREVVDHVGCAGHDVGRYRRLIGARYVESTPH